MGEFVDFELLIERMGNSCRARVLQSPVGTGAGSVFDLPDWVDSADDYGRHLFQVVFAGPVLSLWQGSLGKAGQKLRLRIRLEDAPDLLAVPWELLDDPDHGVIAIERSVVRSLEGQITPRPLAVRGPLHMLAILSSPSNLPLLEVEEEWRMLDGMLGSLVADKRIDLERLVRPTPERIASSLREKERQVLHFVGHGLDGALELEDPQGGSWTMGAQKL